MLAPGAEGSGSDVLVKRGVQLGDVLSRAANLLTRNDITRAYKVDDNPKFGAVPKDSV